MTRVLVVRPDNNGDVLLAGPALRALAADAEHVTLWVGPRGRLGASSLPGVDEVVVRTLPWIDPAPAAVDGDWLEETVAFASGLRADRAFVLSSFHQSPLPTALCLRAAGVPWIGATSEYYPGSLLDLRHRIDDDVHEVERSLDLVAAAGHRLPDGDDGRLRVRPTTRPNPVPAGAPYVVVHPGASVPARAWSPERNRAAVGALEAAGWRVVVTGAPDETDLTRTVAAGARTTLDLGGRCDWEELTVVLRDAAAVVVGNTGPAHLAAAVGTPVVSLYAPTVPAVRWRPWQVPHELLGQQDIGCAGCRAQVCPVAGHPCIGRVVPDDVLAAVTRLTGGVADPVAPAEVPA
ncbi:glycosyltransferase family 9 protein [Egicoccus halophilus]|uniref:Glycosyl transferase n=1 Tax=Egicoccus halophilus TaxID=1670830 RepID=A0A8J3A6E2_9ACTN|nr:glycosyltransferase family 9 protein [Egicoccus halophilus]GGI04557.1 glycosyl transferase [Egicoccus halophilus]